MKPMMPRQARSMALAAVLGGAIAAAAPASAEVRFGRNVYVGGHDFSHQTFNKKRRGVIHLYDRTPRNQGCTWRVDGRGGKVKVCHLRRR
ncbi:hypothetical protein [Chelatococcus reniformis]|uniref:Uncharacterized protein n=1 Tax=Chelatococcus reniformis TaxID=1494448 RepID=A0A916U3X9_9HYPH|nr:hypothetical protein [Chelatococcus reniformis]GGC59730.1 hypothetical protein GCM10010994_18090 [Chelatococcus reniformis]